MTLTEEDRYYLDEAITGYVDARVLEEQIRASDPALSGMATKSSVAAYRYLHSLLDDLMQPKEAAHV